MKTLVRSIAISITFLFLCGFIFPLLMTGASQLFFHRQANGSMILYNGKAVGSELLGQSFADMRYFHGRVSAVNYNTYKAGDNSYAGVASGSSNLAPSNPVLSERVQTDIAAFLKANPGVRKEDIPTDLLTSSASGLDPNISPDAAKIQIPAISKATGISSGELEKIVSDNTEGRTLGILGASRVNILKANIEITKRLKK